MRITNSHRDHTTNLAKCTKMTEGEHRIHGMNGVTDSGTAAVQEETTQSTPPVSDTYNNLGGRLKFFKNGRFILELARAREGEKVAWVPVPKKTFWPPQGSATSLSTYRQESSTSLSVSDDNSSIQSSPWQRDHTWKQTSPQRNNSTNLDFYFYNNKRKNKNRALLQKSCWQYKLQRAPYLIITEQQRTKCITLFNNSGNKCNNSKCINNSNNKSSAISSNIKSRQTLANVVQLLWNKSLQALNNLTSPRKRILRELERVTIDDLSIYNKRCRGKVNQQSKLLTTTPHQPQQLQQQQQQQHQLQCTTNNNNNNNDNISTNVCRSDQTDINGFDYHRVVSSSSSPSPSSSSVINPCVSVTSTKNSSYSITSLLGGIIETNRDGNNQIEKLPSSQYTTKITTTPADNHSHINTTYSSNNTYISTDEVDGPSSKNTLDNILLKNKRSPIIRGGTSPSNINNSTIPSPSSHYNYSAVNAAHHQHQIPPSHYMSSPYSIYSSVLHQHHHQHLAAANYISPYYHHPQSSVGAAAAYVAARGAPPPGYYHHPLVSQTLNPTPWNTYEQHQGNAVHRDDSDVPLNLSKHAD